MAEQQRREQTVAAAAEAVRVQTEAAVAVQLHRSNSPAIVNAVAYVAEDTCIRQPPAYQQAASTLQTAQTDATDRSAAYAGLTEMIQQKAVLQMCRHP